MKFGGPHWHCHLPIPRRGLGSGRAGAVKNWWGWFLARFLSCIVNWGDFGQLLKCSNFLLFFMWNKFFLIFFIIRNPGVHNWALLNGKMQIFAAYNLIPSASMGVKFWGYLAHNHGEKSRHLTHQKKKFFVEHQKLPLLNGTHRPWKCREHDEKIQKR